MLEMNIVFVLSTTEELQFDLIWGL